MRIDESWYGLNFPDFTAYDRLDPATKITLLGADPFFPDACLPDHVIEATKKALDDGKTHYSLDNGYAEPVLKEALVRKLAEYNDLHVDPETELIVVPSSAFGLYLATRLCVRPNMGDEVLNIDPGFAENFNDVYQMGAVSVSVPVYAEDGFQLRIDELEKAVTERTRCLILTNPNNPTGTVYTRERLLELAEFLVRHDLMIVVDQDFERQIYDGIEYTTFATLPGMKERTITVFGTSKDLGLTGFRVAYMVANKEIVDILKPATFNMHGPTNTFAQYGVAAAYNDPAYLDEWFTIFNRRRSYGQKVLDAIDGVTCPLPDGGFYFWVDISSLGTSIEVRDWLIDDAQIGISPGTWFGGGGEGFIRVMYGAVPSDATYEEGINRIRDSLIRLRARRLGQA